MGPTFRVASCLLLSAVCLQCGPSPATPGAAAPVRPAIVPPPVASEAAQPGAADPFVHIALSTSHACAVRASGGVWCWGSAVDGATGQGRDDGGELHPRQVPGLTNATRTALSSNLSCAALRDGGMQCWGLADSVLGDQRDGDPADGPVRVRDVGPVLDLSSTLGEVCAVQGDGTVRMWESLVHDQYFAMTARPAHYCAGCVLPGIAGATQVSSGYASHCALLASGQISCWGHNEHGQLGNGAEAETPEGVLASRTPTTVVGIEGAKNVSVSTHACAVLGNGTVACWGKNDAGQLGDGGTVSRPRAGLVMGIEGAKQVAVGGRHTCALLESGAVACWGDNASGQLGDGTLQARPKPVEVKGLRDATMIAAGSEGTCAILRSGELACWGSFLILGDDSTDSRPVPGPLKW